jgi:hypothetical protein
VERVQVVWDGASRSLRLKWSTPYNSGSQATGRLGKGSGTTPTIIGTYVR